MTHNQAYIPGLGIDWLTQYYDLALATVFQERRFRMPVVTALPVLPGQRILDIGCGTATLSLLLFENRVASFIAGLDIDPVMLATAQRKAAKASAALHLARASATELPYDAGSFDHVVSSLMLHHLTAAQKRAMLNEAFRVLRSGGALVVLDFGPFTNRVLARLAGALFGTFEQIDDNLYGRVPSLLGEAGFVNVQVSDVAFGGLVKLYQGQRP